MSAAAIARLEASRRQLRAALLDPGLPLEGLMLQRAARCANEALQPLLEPLARKHPWLLVAGAAALGGALVAARPWRWPLLALLPTLLPAVLPGLVAGIAQKGLLEALLALLQKPVKAPPPPAP